MQINHIVPIEHIITLSCILFCIGVMGVLLRRNAIIILMCIELMLNAVNILFATFSAYNGNPDGQIFVFFILTVAAAEAAIGLAILIVLFRNLKSIHVDDLGSLKG